MKKILSIMLVLAMVVSLLPAGLGGAVTVRAAVTLVGNFTELETAASASGTGDEVRLTASFSGTTQLFIERDVTIDLNGHNLTITVNSGNGIKINSGFELTITDTSAGADGELSVTNNASSPNTGNGAAINTTDGTLIIESGRINATGGGGGAGIGGGWGGDNGKITINGGEITAAGGGSGAGIGGGGRINATGIGGSGGEITINGGEITATGGVSVGAGIGGGGGSGSSSVAGSTGGDGGTITITGGERITATGNGGGAGIGGGGILVNGSIGGNGGIIRITGGELIIATSNGSGAGIGGGSSSGTGGTGGSGGDIRITGGEIITATGGDGGAGIGGGAGGNGGNITIDDGEIKATGGNNAAGIGGGWGGSGGIITINDGEIIATGGFRAAGIGGGRDGNGGEIEINDGLIIVTGGENGAGIGSGPHGSGYRITITGGEVYAEGGYSSAGIGSGFDADSGIISIENGTVNATGGQWGGAGIGGGASSGFTRDGGEITISGGIIIATGGDGGAGIGGGNGGNGGEITIDGGIVGATGGSGGAGIGGGGFGASGDIAITGGDVTATVNVVGTATGAGIGSGGGTASTAGGAVNTITISGGTVTAINNSGGAGIGSGSDGAGGGTVTISGGTITATNTGSGAGIGSGRLGASGTVIISDGTVIASGSTGAGIGGGDSGVGGGTVVISGGSVTARSNQASGIGVGLFSNGGTTTITGGTVTASTNTATGANRAINNGSSGTVTVLGWFNYRVNTSNTNPDSPNPPNAQIGTLNFDSTTPLFNFGHEFRFIQLVSTAPQYTVTVVSAGTGATGGGLYAAGDPVEIEAGTHPSSDMQFVEWTATFPAASPPPIYIADINSPSTTFPMPASDVTVTANFAQTYTTTVNVPQVNGSDPVDLIANPITNPAAVIAGTTVNLPAVTARSGFAFVEWEVLSGGVTIINPTSADGNAYFEMGTQNVVINAIFVPAAFTFSGETLPAGIFGTPYTASVTAASGGSGSYSYSSTELPVWLSLNPSGEFSGTPDSVTAATGATFTVTATDTVSGATVNATYTLVINPLSISNYGVGDFDPLTYNSNPQTPNAAVTVTVNGNVLPVTGAWSDVTNVGETTNFTASGNFTGTITGRNPNMQQAEQAPLFITPPAPQTFGNPPFQLVTTGGSGTGAVTFALVSGDATVTSGGMVTIIGAGNVVVTATKADDNNHNSVTSAPLAFIVSPAVYGGATPNIDRLVQTGLADTFSVQLSGLASGGTAFGTISGYTFGSVSDSLGIVSGIPSISGDTLYVSVNDIPQGTIGTATINITMQTQNYGNVSATVTLILTDKTQVTITANAADTIYTGLPYAGLSGISASGGLDSALLEIMFAGRNTTAYSPSASPPVDAGDYSVTISVPSDNPTYFGSEIFNFSVSPAALYISVNDITVQTGETPVFTYTVTGMVNNEAAETALTSPPTVESPTADINTAGTYPIVITGGTASANYHIAERVDGTLTVVAPTDTPEITPPPTTYTPIEIRGSVVLGDPARPPRETPATEPEEPEAPESIETEETEILNRIQFRIGSNLIICLNENIVLVEMDTVPVIQDGRTLIPLRFVANALGAHISWNEAAREVTLTKGDRTLIMPIGTITPELAALGMDVPPTITDGRTMVPLRFISEFFGATVLWDETERTIEIIF